MTQMDPSGPTFPSATLDCPKCQAEITYYDVTGSSYYGCPNCHSFFKYEHEEPPEILAALPTTTPTILLPIGAEAYLNNQFVRVVGFIHKKEAGTSYDWSEYIVLQQDGRSIQLAEYQGHWMLIEPTEKLYRNYPDNQYYIESGSQLYRLYNRYQPAVLNAVGEFDWNIFDDEKLGISEYIQPPYMLINERTETRSDWYEARYVSRGELAKAFGMTEDSFPVPLGVGAIEPADPEDRWSAVVAFTGMIVVALIVLQLVMSIVKPSKQVFSESYQTQSDSTGTVRTIVTPSFDVSGPAALNVDISADLHKQWLELPVTLINEQSGRSYDFTKTLEYYYGVESGASWSEGSRDDNAILARVPSGRYHLNLYPAREPGQAISFRISIQQNTLLGSNLIVLLGLLTIYPIILYWRRSWYDSQRWSNSNFGSQE